MPVVTIREVPIEFPFEPYEIQKIYMSKVLECLQNDSVGILESPTGTGKTLSLLCSSLAWLSLQKAKCQKEFTSQMNDSENDYLHQIDEELNKGVGDSNRQIFQRTRIIYASRTHSQLSQAMSEFKRSAYKHLKASIMGSRHQLCVHPDVAREENNAIKTHLCRLKVQTRSCLYHGRVERVFQSRVLPELDVADIEDLVKLGEKHKFCPFYMSAQLKNEADIIFMPYNYILDPRIRKVMGVGLYGNIVILDEGHNVERICEDSASIQIRSTDIAVCIDEVTQAMKALTQDTVSFDENTPKDVDPNDIAEFKTMLLEFEKEVDAIEITTASGVTFQGEFIFQLLEKAHITLQNYNGLICLIDKLIQLLTTNEENSYNRRGSGLQKFSELLEIAFLDTAENYKERINKCFKVHFEIIEVQKFSNNSWHSKTSSTSCRVLNYWCFSPGFGMSMLMAQGVKSLIITSGTLAPLKPLITELHIDVGVKLENPHIITNEQVCVRILTTGPDGEPLNSSYRNRDNPKYISSLGRSILNLCRIIPDGLLIFFPSYPILKKCQDQWQSEGIWSCIDKIKSIFVEPKQKDSFNSAMNDYYSKINDVNYKGAIFIGVCRGKVSEGLDFADNNGRAVIIIGLPFPPLKDPRIDLKKKYLDLCNSRDKEYLKGMEWYSLEAIRAVNQAIGRIIRHRNDYGAVIMLDERFVESRIQSQLSLWLRDRIKVIKNFGDIIRDLRNFFVNAKQKFPVSTKVYDVNSEILPSNMEINQTYSGFLSKTNCGNFDFSSSASCSLTDNNSALVNIQTPKKRKKIVIVASSSTSIADKKENDYKEYINLVKKYLIAPQFKQYVDALTNYCYNDKISELIDELEKIFQTNYIHRFLLDGLAQYIKDKDKVTYEEFRKKMK